jgi:hypothetical protein
MVPANLLLTNAPTYYCFYVTALFTVHFLGQALMASYGYIFTSDNSMGLALRQFFDFEDEEGFLSLSVAGRGVMPAQ